MPSDKKILLICASPRKKGTSVMLLKRMQQSIGGEILYLYQSEIAEIVRKMQEVDVIVISGPCYINSYPSVVTRLLETAARQSDWKPTSVYGIINGGMPYIHTHISGLHHLELFCQAVGLKWQGGFVLGGGPILDGQPLEKHPSQKKLVPAFRQFVNHVEANTPSPASLYENAQTGFGPIMTHLVARLLSFATTRRLKKHGHHPDQPRNYVIP